MPQLTWVGKDKVKNHHHEVPFHLLDKIRDFQAAPGKPDNRRDNILIHGDNLLALKSLLPEFGGRVNCIYIDPPYNTGNEGWVYNDNVNDPRIQKWLDAVVGKEGEDLSRHDKWLCMMYPRLKLLKQLLADDGVIAIHIDENACTLLHTLMIEIFGAANDLGTIVWDKKNPKGDARKLSYQHENIIVFCNNRFHDSKRLRRFKKNAPAMLKKAAALFAKIGKTQIPDDLKATVKKYGLPKEILDSFKFKADLEWVNQEFQKWLAKQDFSNGEKAYKFIDKNGNIFQTVSMAWPNKDEAPGEYFYSLIHPVTRKICPLPERGWRNPWETMQNLLDNDKVVFGTDESTQPRNKYLLSENLSENIPSILHFGGSDDVLQKSIDIKLENPKPHEFAIELLSYFTDKDSVVLDSFVGSGTTAHAVLNLNKRDGGDRRFIGIEMMDYAENITAERIRRVINGYGTKPETQQGTGGGFSFYRVGDALFDAERNLNPAAPVESVRRYIAYTEGLPASALPEHERPPENGEIQHKNPVSPYFLGMKDGAAYLFHYEPDRATDLSLDFLQTIRTETLPEKPERWVIYADRTLLSQEQMKQLGIVFKRIPRDISKL
ncbi:MAG: site-specific DNA-methyltransferase [Ottowia sp.]